MRAFYTEIPVVAALLLAACAFLGYPPQSGQSDSGGKKCRSIWSGLQMTSGFWRSLAAVALWAVSTGIGAGFWTVEGRVVGVSDGDTITVLDASKVQHKVRLSGIDAPEKGQAFGNASKENLSRLVFDRQVDAHCHKKDRYGREVCKVMRGGTDVNLEQLRAGMAWWYREYAKEQSVEDRAAYAAAEDGAKASRTGLWKDAKPVAPWEWRRQ